MGHGGLAHGGAVAVEALALRKDAMARATASLTAPWASISASSTPSSSVLASFE